MYKDRRITRLHYLLPALLALIFTQAALAGGGDPAVATKAWPLIENGALLIDVRTQQEFDEGHIEGALNIPYANTEALMSAIGDDKQRAAVLYCRSGHRAGIAKANLEEKGYSQLFNATGYDALKASKP